MSADPITAGQLRAFIERIETLQASRKEISTDIAAVFAEAKGQGFDTKALRTIVRLRSQDPSERAEQQAILELYLDAIGQGDLFLSIRSEAGEPAQGFK